MMHNASFGPVLISVVWGTQDESWSEKGWQLLKKSKDNIITYTVVDEERTDK